MCGKPVRAPSSGTRTCVPGLSPIPVSFTYCGVGMSPGHEGLSQCYAASSVVFWSGDKNAALVLGATKGARRGSAWGPSKRQDHPSSCQGSMRACDAAQGCRLQSAHSRPFRHLPGSLPFASSFPRLFSLPFFVGELWAPPGRDHPNVSICAAEASATHLAVIKKPHAERDQTRIGYKPGNLFPSGPQG